MNGRFCSVVLPIVLCATFSHSDGADDVPSAANQLFGDLAAAPRELATARDMRRTDLRGTMQVLKAGDDAFLAYITSPLGAAPALAILTALNPDADLNQTLPRALAQAPADGGWLSLMFQAPPVGPEFAPQLCARLKSALALVQERQIKQVVLSALGHTVDASLECFKDGLPPQIAALATLGTWHAPMSAIKVPMLDITPADSRAAQLAKRARAAPGKSGYRPLEINASDDRFSGAEIEVAKRIRGWLLQLTRNSKA